MGKKVKAAMESGPLATDEIVVGIIKDAIRSSECRRGLILEDFSRTIVQAIKVRTRGDTHESTRALVSGRSNHVKFAPPNVDGKDDITGEPLYQRKDDTEATLGSRLKDFYKQMQPVIDFYREQGKLVEVNPHKEMHQVTEQIRKSLGLD
uniref:Adenylate kinase active site lid domain-containing protein n=1 Tax=Peronospora matthiolae TaxID=2874970 RepID=A0AAV1VMD2_9STRA